MKTMLALIALLTLAFAEPAAAQRPTDLACRPARPPCAGGCIEATRGFTKVCVRASQGSARSSTSLRVNNCLGAACGGNRLPTEVTREGIVSPNAGVSAASAAQAQSQVAVTPQVAAPNVQAPVAAQNRPQ